MLDLALNPSLHLGSSNHELSFELFGGGGGVPNQLICPPNCCHVGLASICHLLVFYPHLTDKGPIYGSQPIGLLYFIGTRTLDPHLNKRVGLRFFFEINKEMDCIQMGWVGTWIGTWVGKNGFVGTWLGLVWFGLAWFGTWFGLGWIGFFCHLGGS